MSTLPHTSGSLHSSVVNTPRSSILCSRGHFACPHDLRFTRLCVCYKSTRTLHTCDRPSTFHCRRIGRYVLWNFLFRNANIATWNVMFMCMTSDDSCLISTAALREVHRFAQHSIYVGHGRNGWMWAGSQRSTLVLGPPRSGKTSSLVIPNILLSGGAVVSTSTKPDVMLATAPSRSRDGWAFLYDPSGEIDCPATVERVGWSPLTTAAELGLSGGDCRRHGRREPSEWRSHRRTPLDRAVRRPALDPAARGCARRTVHA